MSPWRRRWLGALGAISALGALGAAGLATSRPARAAASAPASDADPVRRGRTLAFPRDHGAHLGARTEWWYATGWLGEPAAPTHGFQVTFFRSRTGLAAASRSRFAARHLLFAHAALTDLAGRRHLHAARIARWSGEPDARPDFATLADASLRIGPWWMRREGGSDGAPARWRAQVGGAAFELELELARTQPLLLQGDAGFSRKGPDERQASHYYSEPQLDAQATLVQGGRRQPSSGRGWLDHEWSDELLHPEAVGWDWIGINLFDGSALTAFQLRRAAAPDGAPGAALWAGGSWRVPGGAPRVFAADEVRFAPGRRWRSPATRADYPVEWQVQTPAGRFGVRTLLDAQELAGHGIGGTVYWEGLAELVDAGGQRVGLGYLEMTGYAARLRLG